MAKLMIPTPLRQFVDGQDTVEVEASTVGEALDKLTSQHTELRRHLFSDEGKLRSFVNVYMNDEDIRYLDKEATAVSADDTISIVPSIAGGSGEDLPELSNEDSALRWASTSPPPVSARSAWSISTSSRCRTCSARSSTEPLISDGLKSTQRPSAWRTSILILRSSNTTHVSRAKTPSTSSRTTTSSSTAPTISRRAIWSTTPACC